MAERVRFELTSPVKDLRFSRLERPQEAIFTLLETQRFSIAWIAKKKAPKGI